MTPEMIQSVAQETILTLLMVSGPLMLVALVVGLLVALFQALTSIQEVTLTFVPKILLVFAVMLLIMPFMAGQLQSFTQDLFNRMAYPTVTEPTVGENQADNAP